MLRMGAEHLVALVQSAEHGKIQRFGAAAGENDTFRLLHAQKPRRFLTAGLHHAPGTER